MKVKALKDFGGQYAMRKGEICELEDYLIAELLVADGYVEISESKKESAKRPALKEGKTSGKDKTIKQ